MRFLRPTLRIRMALLYGGLVLLVGVALLFTSMVLMDRSIARLPFFGVTRKVTITDDTGAKQTLPASQLGAQARHDSREYLLHTGLIYFAVIVVIGASGGYLLARQALRPIARVTRTAKQLSTETLDQRIDLGGPDDELRELADTFDEMLARLDAAFDGQKLFVANASHELRTPLSTIMGYAETLGEEGELPTELRTRFGSTIREEAQRMLQIIEDLMSLSRIEADRFLAPNEVVSIEEIIEIAAGNASRLRGASQCEIIVDIAPGLPSVRGDRSQLLQVVDNLVSNAVRYGCTGPGAKVRLSAARTDGWITLTVTDYGPGIPREHLPRVTERFYRVDPARSRESGGTGLGLAIVKHIVERHRGALDIKSIVGEGTSVSVRLPAAVA